MESAILAKEAMRLSPLERAHIIDALWRSLDPVDQEAIDQAWLKESQDRLQAYRAGEFKAMDGDEVVRSIVDELSK